MLKAYLVYIADPKYGMAVIAKNKPQAKKYTLEKILEIKSIGGFVEPYVYRYGICIQNLNANPILDADITGLSTGVIPVSKDSLLRGLHDCTGLLECDLCGETATLFRDPKLFNGHSINAVCIKCHAERTGAV